MLVLARSVNENILLDFTKCTLADLEALKKNPIVITVSEINGAKVRLGINAPRCVGIDREEVWRSRQAGPRPVTTNYVGPHKLPTPP